MPSAHLQVRVFGVLSCGCGCCDVALRRTCRPRKRAVVAPVDLIIACLDNTVPVAWHAVELPRLRENSMSVMRKASHGATWQLILGIWREQATLQVFDCPALKRAKVSVSKSGAFTPRPKMWLRRKRVHEMVTWCREHPGHPMMDTYVALYLTAYAFLLRLPSEALPITVGHDSGPCAIFREGEKVVLQLKRR